MNCYGLQFIRCNFCSLTLHNAIPKKHLLLALDFVLSLLANYDNNEFTFFKQTVNICK